MATGASRCFQISAANVLLGAAICFYISHRSRAGDRLLAPVATHVLAGVIMCAGSGSPTGVHEFVLYCHSSLSQSRHSEGGEPCRHGVDFGGLPFVAGREFWAHKVESLSSNSGCSISPLYRDITAMQAFVGFKFKVVKRLTGIS